MSKRKGEHQIEEPLHQVVIFAGPFGSGKTETAINYSLYLAQRGREVTLVDLDVVTTYFRTREVEATLAERGVKVVAPSEAGQIDLPSITPEIWGALGGKNGLVIVDMGGDVPGARTMSQFSPRLNTIGYSLNLVINPYRPFTSSVEGIERVCRDISTTSRLETSALVSNPNLMAETTDSIIEEGHATVAKAGTRLGLQVAFLCVDKGFLPKLAKRHHGPILPLTRYILAPWER